MVDMEEKNTCIYLTMADITLITLLLLADIAIFNRTLDRITIQINVLTADENPCRLCVCILLEKIQKFFKIRLRESKLCIFELRNIMYFVLLAYKDERIDTCGSLTLKSSPLIKTLCSFGNAGREYGIVLNNVVSSAYRMKEKYSDAHVMSFNIHLE